MSTKAKRHTHKYHQISLGGIMVWGCALPNCNHYMPKHMESMVPGKAAICWACLKEIILDSNNMQFQKPICRQCELLDRVPVLENAHLSIPTPENTIPQETIESHIDGVPVCKNCKQHPASISNTKGLCVRCNFAPEISDFKYKG